MVVVCLTALAGSESKAQGPVDELAAPGISLELARHRAATIGDLRYELYVSVPAARGKALAGEVTIRFRWSDPQALPLVIDFDQPGRRVHELVVNGVAISDPDFRHNHIVVPAGTLRHGAENVVRMAFEVGDGPLNRPQRLLYTLFVPDRAHHALPLFDQPDLKARFTLTLEMPDRWEAVSNGRLVNEERFEDERRRVTFAETDPIPTYLFAFAAGELERVEREVGGRPLVLYHQETDRDRVERNLDAIFELHATALAWLEEYTGVAYPFDRFEFVAVPSFQYNGMEHPGAIYYRASSLFLEESATQAQQLGRASLIAHETAHMWFGDLVTMRWFDDVWTKEVFANFYAAKIVNPAFPEIDHDLRFLLAHHPAAYRVDRSRGANPIRQPLPNLAMAGSLYGPIIYQKAPIVMRQLERLVGEDVFRDGIREYLTRFAFSNATWPELIEILDARTEVNLADWSRVWVEEAGRPDVAVVRDGARVLLEQRDPEVRGRVWTQTLDPAAGWVTGEVVALDEIALGDEPAVLGLAASGIPTAPPDWVLPDARGYGYAHFHADAGSRTALLDAIPELQDPVMRASALLVLWDAVLAADLAPESFLELLLVLAAHEAEEQLLTFALGLLETVHWMLLDDDRRSAWSARIERTLLARLREPAPATLKSTLLTAFRGVVTTPEGVDTLRAIWSGELDIPDLSVGESDRTAMALALALREAPGWREVLDREEEAIENPERRERLRFLRSAVDADPFVREAFFESLRERENRRREPWVQDALGYLNHPLRAGHGRTFLRPSLEMLEEIQRTGDIFFPQNWMRAALAGHSSGEAVAIVEAFLDERPDYPGHLREKILQALDLTERAARIHAARRR